MSIVNTTTNTPPLLATTDRTTTTTNRNTELDLDRTSLLYASNTIRRLFGADFGPCYGEFYCSHGRIRGTLYVVTNGILFYSNLLGFERRLCLQYTDMSTLVLHRTTSILIEIANYDTYILRSFHDRVFVLQLLTRLKQLVEKNLSRRRLEFRNDDDGETHANNRENQYQSLYESSNRHFKTHSPPKSQLSFPSLYSSYSASKVEYGTTNTGLLSIQNRPRAASDSVIQQQQQLHDSFSGQQLDSSDNGPVEENQAIDSRRLDELFTPTIEESWNQTANTISTMKEGGITDIRLQCSLNIFYDLFLRDEAPYSFHHYQKEVICDREVTITPWSDKQEQIDPNHINVRGQTRILSFIHPIKNAMGIGPTEARTTRTQHIRQYEQFGITLENRTIVEGIPSSDAFFVKDYWRVESDGPDRVTLSIRFGIEFTKRTMLRNIIEKSILRETRYWLDGYCNMIQDALSKGNETLKIKTNLPSIHSTEAGAFKVTNNEQKSRLNVGLTVMALAFISIFLLLEVAFLHVIIQDIREELKSLQALTTLVLLVQVN